MKNSLLLLSIMLLAAEAQAQRIFKPENVQCFRKPRAQEGNRPAQPLFLRSPRPVAPVRAAPSQEGRNRFHDMLTFRRFMHQLRVFTHPEANLATKTASATNLIRLTKRLKTERFSKKAQEHLAQHNLTLAKLEQFAQTNKAFHQFERLLKRYLSQQERAQKHPSTSSQNRLKRTKQAIKTLYNTHLSGEHRAHANDLLKQKSIAL
jgi:hypothetical protein